MIFIWITSSKTTFHEYSVAVSKELEEIQARWECNLKKISPDGEVISFSAQYSAFSHLMQKEDDNF